MLTTAQSTRRLMRSQTNEAAQNPSSKANPGDVAETNFGKNPCPCGTQRCYPGHCDALQRYKSEKEALK